MRTVRCHPLVRAFALLLIAWLGADSLTRGNCPHDLVLFERAGHAEVGGASSHDRSDDRDDVNHCSCHWQYLAAVSPACVMAEVVQPLMCPPRSAHVDSIARPLDRPPQHVA